MNWQGFVRALRPFYKHITVCARAPSAALYADCCDEFIPHDVQGQSNAHVVFDVVNPAELQRVLSLVPPDTDHLVPLRFVPELAQTFICFGHPDAQAETADIIVHARANPLAPHRNWGIGEWTLLVENLCKRGWRVGAIGLSQSTFFLPGVVDYRDVPLPETMDRLAGARLALGPSSGPLHLAALCGTPHLVWTDRRTYGMGKTSREKYERWWNPLDTSVRVMDEYGFDPSVDAVLLRVEESLQHEKPHI